MLIANADHALRLRQDPLFAGLPDSAISRLLARLQALEFAADASLYARDARAEFLYLVEEGSLQITTPGGRLVALSGLRCGEEAASDMTTYLCSATAITSVKALRIPRAVLAELALAAPSLRMQALPGLSEELSGEKLQGPVTVEQPADEPLRSRDLAGWISVIAAPPAIYFLADSTGLIAEASLFLAILSATVLMWLFKQYVGRKYAGQAKIKLVFTAIDQEPKDYGYLGQDNVTGISEVLPLDAIRETLLHLRGGQAARIAVLTSPMPTGMGRMQQLKSFDWAPHKLVAFHASPYFDSWQRAVADMAQSADVILVLSHHALQVSVADTRLVPGAGSVGWLNQHAKPLPVGTSADYVEDGGALAVYPSSLEMGELAMGYALGWLRAGTKAELPLIESAHFRIGARATMLRERHLTLPRIYGEAAHLEQLYFP